MARDKLITIRIEREKREAFNNLAKSQNTDTASLLYDFISGCLDGRIDISLVTGKKQWIDKIDNQIDSERIDKLETDTQRLDHWIGALSERLNDWILRSDRRLTDCDRELSDKITSLEHRLNALAIQLDSQKIDRIDTDSQQIDDMKPLLKREKECSIAAPIPTGEPSPGEPVQPAIGTVTSESDSSIEGEDAIGTVTPEVSPSPPGTDAIASIDGTVETVNTSPFPPSPPLPPDAIGTLPTVEAVEPISTIETVASAIETVPGETDSIEPVRGEAVDIGNKPWYTAKELLDCHYPNWPGTRQGLQEKADREHWPKRTRRGSKGNPYEYQAVLPE